MTRGRILILCLAPPGIFPGQRFRFEQYIPALRAAGFEVDQEPFWDLATMAILYEPGHLLAKVQGVLRGFARRVGLLARSGRWDHVFIHLEAAPIGPPLVERALLALGKRVVYDIDDAIYIASTSQVNRLAAPFRWRSKVSWLAARATKVTTVNQHVRDWASAHARDVVVLPTTIDTSYHRRTAPREPEPTRVPVIGWTGTHSTARALELVRPALVELQRTHEFTFRVICSVDPGFPELRGYEFLEWRKETEIADLELLDVGLMPTIEEPFSLAKVGFKAIQYGALEIPTVASDFGSSRDVVVDGETGFLVANQTQQWVDRLRRLLDDPALRQRMGRAAHALVTRTYTVEAQTPNYLSLFG